MTSKDSANARLFARLEEKGWMQETVIDWPDKMPQAVKDQSVQYVWTEKGARLLPQLLAFYVASGNMSPEHV